MTKEREALTLAQEVIQMLGAPSPLHFSKEEIIKWQECNTAIKEALAQPEQEPTNLERHERNVQQLFGTPQPKEPEQEPDVYIPADALRQLKGTSLLILRSVPLYGYRGDGLTPLYTTPPQRKPLMDEMVLAGARALAKRHADSCGLDFDDVWKYYAEEHKDDAKAVIEAAHGIKGDA